MRVERMTDVAPASVLDAARALVPLVRASADWIEEHRRLPEALVEAMAEAGLFRMFVPPDLCGVGPVDPETYVLAIEEVARADGSAGWCVVLPAAYSAAAGCLREDTAREIFGDRRACVAGSTLPKGRAQVVAGGYRVTGRWSFASGSAHATWLSGGVAVYEGDDPRLDVTGAPETRCVFFPAADCSIVDVWDVTGLRGTSSNDFLVDDLFVPRERSVPRSSPVRPRHPDPVYAYAAGAVPVTAMGAGAHSPWSALVPSGFAAVALGIARGAIDAFVELARAKPGRGGAAMLGDDPLVQHELGEAELRLLAARALVHETVRDVWETVRRTGSTTADQMVLMRAVGTHATAEAARVVEAVWKAGGATSIFVGHPLERRFRDIHVTTQNIAVGAVNYGVVGRLGLGR